MGMPQGNMPGQMQLPPGPNMPGGPGSIQMPGLMPNSALTASLQNQPQANLGNWLGKLNVGNYKIYIHWHFTIADLMGSNFPPQGNQVVPNSPSVQMMPSPQSTGQSVSNPNMPIQVKYF